MKYRTAIPLVALALAITIPYVPVVFAPPPCGGGTPNYSLSISPNVPVGLGTTITMTLSESGGARNSAYTIAFNVVKPNGTGSATSTKTLNTDTQCNGSVILSYPDPTFTATSGTVATDVGGVYRVIVNQTAPTNTGNIATGQFTISSQLTVVVSQPVGGSIVQRSQTITLSATVSTLGGPDTSATVSANSPTGSRVFLLQTSPGVYAVNYQVLTSDPIGAWTILIQASDSQGNTGAGSPVTVTIAKNDLVVDSLETYNSRGIATSFSPGDTIFAFFRVRYSSGTPLVSGQYRVEVFGPSGAVVANLTSAYDSSRFGFYTSTGYPVPQNTIGGTWTLVIVANSINDGFGNTGPGLDTSVPVQIVIVTSPLSYWPFLLAAGIAIVSAIVTVKRLDTSLVDFQHLEQMMGGPLPRGSSIFLLGDAGSGKSILSYQLLHDELESGRPCALLSYDAFPEDIQARMGEFGWDIISSLRKGRLRILDCYSGLAGGGEGAIKDPSDLTELNIQVTSFITKAKGGPVTLILDSLTPIFNGVEGKQAISFIQTLSAKIKKTGGLFIVTASKGAIPDESSAKIKTMSDGVLELNVLRTGRKSRRFLTVLKMEGRRVSPNSVQFEIHRSKGLVFRVSRFGLLKKEMSHPLRWRLRARRSGPSSNKPDTLPPRDMPGRLR